MRALGALIAGLLFGAGLCISGMTWPARVTGFLDVAGAWDPSLAFVMAGAVGTYAIASRIVRRRGAPLLAETFQAPRMKGIDARLLGGAALFGVGWGLSGYCPGPALVSVASAASVTLVFVGAMSIGMLAGKMAPGRTAPSAALAALLTLVACSNEPRTGVFVPGPVVGMRYETLTRSGLTDAQGRFEYDEGENVTFSVGGVVLGSANGAESISVFDLFDVTPPVSAPELRRELIDGAARGFDRAANVSLFLHALDADRDPATGLDVLFWGAGLAGVTLDFAERFDAFALSSFPRFAAAHPGIDRHLDVAAVLPRVYAALGLVVSNRLVTTVTLDQGNDGSAESTFTYAYDSLGRVIGSQSVRADAAPSRGEFAFNARGQRRLVAIESDLDGDGTFERIESTTVTYDDDGNRSVDIAEDTTGGAIGERRTRTYAHDIAGNVESIVVESDDAGNGSVEMRSVSASTYDAAGRRLTTRIVYDNDNDGTPDRITSDANTYDAAGNAIETINVTDSDADGVSDAVETVARVHDARGRVLSQTSELRVGSPVIERTTRTATFDGDDLVAETIAGDTGGDGSIDYRLERTTIYDAVGLPTLETTALTSGTNAQRSTRTITYDDWSNVLRDITEYDEGGGASSRRTLTFTYDELGNRTSLLYQDDTDGDGTADSTTLETRIYVDVADALYAIVHELVAPP